MLKEISVKKWNEWKECVFQVYQEVAKAAAFTIKTNDEKDILIYGGTALNLRSVTENKDVLNGVNYGYLDAISMMVDAGLQSGFYAALNVARQKVMSGSCRRFFNSDQWTIREINCAEDGHRFVVVPFKEMRLQVMSIFHRLSVAFKDDVKWSMTSEDETTQFNFKRTLSPMCQRTVNVRFTKTHNLYGPWQTMLDYLVDAVNALLIEGFIEESAWYNIVGDWICSLGCAFTHLYNLEIDEVQDKPRLVTSDTSWAFSLKHTKH